MKFSKKQLLQLAAALFAVIVFAFSETSTAFAGTAEAAINFPLHLEYGKGGLNPSKSYRLVITAEDAGAPMPQDAENGVCTLPISRELGSDYEIEISYQNPGDYWYEIKLEDTGNKILTRDWLHVQVTQENGELTPTMSLRENSKTSEKIAEFTAADPDQPSDTPTPTVTATPSTTPTATPGATETPGASVTPTVTAAATPTGSVIPTISGNNSAKSSGSNTSKASTGLVFTGKVSTGDTSNTRIWQICLGISAALLVIFLAAVRNRKRHG